MARILLAAIQATFVLAGAICWSPVLLVSMPALAVEPVAQPAVRANAFLDLLQRAAFEEAVLMFDPDMRDALPATKLQEVWESLPRQLGPITARGDAHEERIDQGVLVTIPIDFERLRLHARLVFSENGSMSGFRLVPAANAPPPAMRPDAQDRELRIGQRPHDLPALLRLPEGKGPFPAVVLVHGSGPHDADQTIGPNRTFHWLAERLAERGIASLRYTKRTRAHPGQFADARFTVNEETVDDAVQALELLRSTPDIDAQRIFVAGHSLGAMLAPRIAVRASHIAGVIMIAAPARPLQELVVEQVEYIASLQDPPATELIAQLTELRVAAAQLDDLPDELAATTPLMLGLPAGYWRDLNAYDPISVALSLPQPVLLIQGGRDYQVSAARDFSLWRRAFDQSPRATLLLYPAMNHIFQVGDGPSRPEEYLQNGEYLLQPVEDMARWILQVPRR